MEKPNEDIRGIESLKKLSRGNYDAFELCAKISNTKDSHSSLEIIERLNAPPATLLKLYELGSESNVEKFSDMLNFFSSIPKSDFDTLRVISTDDNGLNAKALLLITGLSISVAMEEKRHISYVIGDLAEMIVKDGLKGEKIYNEYENFLVTVMYNLIISNLGSGTNPYEDLEKLDTPEKMLSTTCDLAKSYVELFKPSGIMRK